MPTNKFSHDRLLRWPEVGQRVGKCRSAVRKMEAAGQFPRRVTLGPRAVAWLESEISQWIAERAAERADAVAMADAETRRTPATWIKTGERTTRSGAHGGERG